MARRFNKGGSNNSDYVKIIPPTSVTAHNVTIAALVARELDDGQFQTIAQFGTSGSDNSRAIMGVPASSDTIRAAQISTTGVAVQASTVGAMVNQRWYVGCARFASTTSRTAERTGIALVSQGTANTSGNYNELLIGRKSVTAFESWPGWIQWVTFWKTAISVSESAALCQNRVDPLTIRPDAILAHVDMTDGKAVLYSPRASGLLATVVGDPFWSTYGPYAIRRKRRRVWFDFGVSDIALTVDETLHAHSTDAIALTQDNTLATQEALHGHSTDAIALTQANALVTQEALHGHTADSVALTVAAALAAQDATHAHTTDAIALLQANLLAAQEALHAHAADSVALTQANALAVAEALHAHTADTVALTQANLAAAADATHAHSADSVVLTQANALVAADALHDHTADLLTLTQANVLAAADALHSHLADVLALQPSLTKDFKVQFVEGLIPASTASLNVTAPASFQAVTDLAKAFLIPAMWPQMGAGIGNTSGTVADNLLNVCAMAQLTAADQLTFTDNSTLTTNNRVGTWLVEYIGAAGSPNEVIVRAVKVFTGAVSALTFDSTAISGISNIANCVPFAFMQGGSNVWTLNSGNVEVVNDGTNNVVRVTRFTATTTINLVVYVVEFTGSNWGIKKVAHSFGASNTNEDETVAASALANSFVYTTAKLTGAQPVHQQITVWLANSTTLRHRIRTLINATTCVSYVITNPLMNVQVIGADPDGTADLAATGTSPETRQLSITTVPDLTAAFIVGYAGSDHAAIANRPSVATMFNFVDASTIQLRRSLSVGGTEYKIQIIDVAGVMGPALPRLLMDDALHGHLADLIALVQANVLLAADATHGHTTDVLALVQANMLALADALHGHTADTLALSSGVTASVNDALHAHTADLIALIQRNTLAAADALHGHTADGLALSQAYILTLADTLHGHTADAVTLTQANALTLADALHGHTADGVVVSTVLNLVVADALHAHAVDAVLLTQKNALLVQEALHGHTADSVALVQQHLLAIADALHGHTAESPGVTGFLTLAVADALHGHTSDNVALIQQQLLAVANAMHAHGVDAVNLTQASTLIVSDTLHAHFADLVRLKLPAEFLDPDLLFHVDPEQRFFYVGAEQRLFFVSADRRLFIITNQ